MTCEDLEVIFFKKPQILVEYFLNTYNFTIENIFSFFQHIY